MVAQKMRVLSNSEAVNSGWQGRRWVWAGKSWWKIQNPSEISRSFARSLTQTSESEQGNNVFGLHTQRTQEYKYWNIRTSSMDLFSANGDVNWFLFYLFVCFLFLPSHPDPMLSPYFVFVSAARGLQKKCLHPYSVCVLGSPFIHCVVFSNRFNKYVWFLDVRFDRTHAYARTHARTHGHMHRNIKSSCILYRIVVSCGWWMLEINTIKCSNHFIRLFNSIFVFASLC